MQQSQRYQEIPTELTVEQFDRFVLPHLPAKRRVPDPKLGWHAILNSLLLFLHMGCQWKRLPIRSGPDGKPELHYSRLHRALDFLQACGVMHAIFVGTEQALHDTDKIDVSVIHGDGTSTAATISGIMATSTSRVITWSPFAIATGM